MERRDLRRPVCGRRAFLKMLQRRTRARVDTWDAFSNEQPIDEEDARRWYDAVDEPDDAAGFLVVIECRDVMVCCRTVMRLDVLMRRGRAAVSVVFVRDREHLHQCHGGHQPQGDQGSDDSHGWAIMAAAVASGQPAGSWSVPAR
jgi:hypothetical protein